jgi:hypothetical protein
MKKLHIYVIILRIMKFFRIIRTNKKSAIESYFNTERWNNPDDKVKGNSNQDIFL